MSSVCSGPARRAGRWLRSWVAAAPGSCAWLLVLAVTALQFQQLPRGARRVVLRADSTNLFQLAHRPLHVMLLSALWIPGSQLLVFLVLFHLFHVPVERWLGTARWLAVVVLAHVGATLAGEGAVWSAIRLGLDPGRMRYTLDIGVSYALAGAAGVLTYRLPRPWRRVYPVAAVLLLAGWAAFSHTFTDIGHLAGFGIGLCCRPLTRRGRGTAGTRPGGRADGHPGARARGPLT